MTEQITAPHLVYTKFNQPRTTTQFVERKRLYTALNLQRPLAIVVAPAGYGKTTLVSSWAAQSGNPCTWLSLDAGDNQLSMFVDYFLGAVERLYPDVVRQVAAGPNSGTVTSFAAVARKLADALDEIDERFTIILDDYHYITAVEIHHFLAELVRFPPRGLNLVISSRAEPPLPLAALRARAQLAEIRTHDLRFTIQEAADYLQRELHQTIDADALALVEKSTEGWIAGLHLAALYLQQQRNASDAAAQLKGHNRFTVDYLALEVLAKQEPEIQAFLLKTSILQRMCPALCDAVVDALDVPAAANGVTPAHSRGILDYLDSHNLFVTTLDDSQQWYRYHHVFQQLLESRLQTMYPKDRIAALFRAASRWCVGQGLIDEAITYGLAAGDLPDAIALIESQRQSAMNAERWQQLERWLGLVQRRQIDMHPQLLLLETWVLHKRQRLAEIPARLDLAEALLAEGNVPPAMQRALQSEVDALRSQQYFNQAAAELTYHTAQRALDYAPREYASARGLAWVFLGAGLFLAHGKEQALAALATGLEKGQVTHGYEYSRVLIIRCFVYWMAADLPSLEQTAAELLRYAQQRDLPESTVWGQYFHGCACYQLNDLAAAREDFLAVMNSRDIAPGFVAIQGAYGFALALQAQGEADAAAAALAMVADYAQQTDNDLARQAFLAFNADLALRQGRLEAALEWVAGNGPRLSPVPLLAFFAAPLAAAAILLRYGTRAAMDEAEQMLRQLETYLAQVHVDRFYIEARALQALLYAQRGERAKALEALDMAITLAQPGGLQRVFLDLDAGLYNLLAELELDEERAAFVSQLRAAINPPARSQHEGSGREQLTSDLPVPTAVTTIMPFSASQPRHPDLIELLTNRELEVLQLLALRLTNKEIAQSLGISTGTVKQHTINVFRKLHVENRREAILQARAMGFQIQTPYPL
ncbi:MAG: LuxR C-terminal-related transcriptional regulator [Caldilineaceae bacterium]